MTGIRGSWMEACEAHADGGHRAPLVSLGRETLLCLMTGCHVSGRHVSGSSQHLCGPARWRQEMDRWTVPPGRPPHTCSLNSLLSVNNSFLPGQREPGTSVPPWSLQTDMVPGHGVGAEVPGLRVPGCPSRESPPAPPPAVPGEPALSSTAVCGPSAPPQAVSVHGQLGQHALGTTSTSKHSQRARPSARWLWKRPRK